MPGVKYNYDGQSKRTYFVKADSSIEPASGGNDTPLYYAAANPGVFAIYHSGAYNLDLNNTNYADLSGNPDLNMCIKY